MFYTEWRLALSGIFGTTSIACWVVLLVPQLIDQWRLKSSEGVSLIFLTVWFLGDCANLLGALWARLLPNVVLLAAWFVVADAAELSSAFYYRYIYVSESSRVRERTEPEEGEESDLPLLASDRLGVEATAFADEEELLESQLPANRRDSALIKYILPVLGVFVAGGIGYAFSSHEQPENDGGDSGDLPISLGPQILGYISALLYLSARIPQIIQNYQRKSVHGLSLLFFVYSTLGNVTYAFQIILYAPNAQYLILNFSWILGSLGTVFQDAIIFAQFYIYDSRKNPQIQSEVLPMENTDETAD
ncbi:PQ loop repeat-domain-containing protein [Lipomyces oligophaga]|uniref:PQ loop repeat-domain-containing protein n=1 Tax=Lipomyces oligophaga TaxID=45792 RepID=UPI0034CDE833